MKAPILPLLFLLALALALYLLPDGSSSTWRLTLHGMLSRLNKPADGWEIPENTTVDINTELLERLQQKDAELAALAQRLRDFEIARSSIPQVRITPSRIIRLGPNATIDTFTIDSGSEDGIAAGDAVTVGQAIVGVVAKVEEHASLVLALSSPGCYLSVRLGPPESGRETLRELCAVQGTGQGGIKAVLFSTGSPASPSWLALTSGLEDGIPEGLLVGSVAGNFIEGEESGTLEAELKSAANLTALDYVTVLSKGS